MTKRQRIAATLLNSQLALLPEYRRFREVLKEVFSQELTPQVIDTLHAALP